MTKAVKISDKLSFEDALEELENIVEALEGGELPIEGMTERFKEGSLLLKHCQNKLKKTELQVDKLLNDDTLEPFEAIEENE